MANPTINSQTLSVGGERTRFAQPRSRITLSSMPSVDGFFAQRFGADGQQITGRGSLTAASVLALKAAVRTIQNAANHAPSTYVDEDGVSHTNCILLQYGRAGEINRESASSFWCTVTWTVLKLVAT